MQWTQPLKRGESYINKKEAKIGKKTEEKET